MLIVKTSNIVVQGNGGMPTVRTGKIVRQGVVGLLTVKTGIMMINIWVLLRWLSRQVIYRAAQDGIHLFTCLLDISLPCKCVI